MPSRESAVFISVLIALIIFIVDFLFTPSIVISILLIVVLTGFIASALAGKEKNSYRIGGIAGGVIGVVVFLVNFFTAPTLSYNLYGLGIDLSLMSQGFIDLLLGFVVSLAIFMFLGAIGGLIAEELLGPRETKPKKKSGNRNIKTM